MCDYSKWPQRTMTQEAWNKTSNDYKNIRGDGTKTLLVLEKGETTLAVVTIVNGYSSGKAGRYA
jgi:hypothetical protein